MGKSKSIANKKNPLEKASFFSQLFFVWLSPFLNFTQKYTFSQEHHYKLPKFDKVSYHKEKVFRGFQRKSTILGMIFAEYKLQLIEFGLVAIICAVLSLLSGNILRNATTLLKEGKLNDMKDIKKLGSYFFGNMILTTISKLIATLYAFRSNRLSLAIRSALLSILLDKLLRLPKGAIPMNKIDPKYKPKTGEKIEK